MTTTRFTKEQLIAKLQHRLTVAAKYPDVEEAELDAAIFQIALASLTAEPALYAAEETLAYAKMGELHLTCLSEPMGDAVIPLYTAPPAPVVPTFDEWLEIAVTSRLAGSKMLCANRMTPAEPPCFRVPMEILRRNPVSARRKTASLRRNAATLR